MSRPTLGMREPCTQNVIRTETVAVQVVGRSIMVCSCCQLAAPQLSSAEHWWRRERLAGPGREMDLPRSRLWRFLCAHAGRSPVPSGSFTCPYAPVLTYPLPSSHPLSVLTPKRYPLLLLSPFPPARPRSGCLLRGRRYSDYPT